MSQAVATILGGSTPFTAALVEALRAASAEGKLPACELRLLGRDREAAEAMARYAQARLGALGWRSLASTQLGRALDGATIVINQIRFGGLAGRASDEAIARACHVAADETLGPGALAAALRSARPLSELASSLARICPDAWIFNLANPLSVTTSVLVRAGAPPKCVGLCELPFTTVAEACRALGVGLDEVQWSYAGFNHRGFVLALKRAGRDLLSLLPFALGHKTIFGIAADDIARLGALPLKYFHLSSRPKAPSTFSRVPFLEAVKAAIARELRASDAPPPSLSQRDCRWYSGAVVPMMSAVLGQGARELVVNCVREDGLCWEQPARVDGQGVRPIDQPINGSPRHWLGVWAAHERAFCEAIAAPSPASIRRALDLDPSVPKSQVDTASTAVWFTHRARGET